MRYLLALLLLASTTPAAELTRLTDTVPFPRGLAMADPDGDGVEMLYVLSRGRARGNGGADPTLDDRAGTIWQVDPRTGETSVYAEPTSPPFRLLDRTLADARDDHDTDRPYCGLRYDEATRSFYIVAFSGIDLAAPHGDAADAESGYFRKNYSDGVLRYDVDARAWSVIDRHEPADGDAYPGPCGGGHVKGPDNLLIVGDTLYVAAKDNDRVVAYDLTDIQRAAVQRTAGLTGGTAPTTRPSEGTPTREKALPKDTLVARSTSSDLQSVGPRFPRIVLKDTITLTNQNDAPRTVRGHSALGYRDGWLYVGFRTTGEVIRVRLDNSTRGELLATLEPFDPATGRSANITDLSIGPDGDVYVLCAQPARVYRITPDPANVRDYRDGENAYLDAAEVTGNPRMKAENLLVTGDGTLYLASGDAYAPHAPHAPHADNTGLGGAVWVYR